MERLRRILTNQHYTTIDMVLYCTVTAFIVGKNEWSGVSVFLAFVIFIIGGYVLLWLEERGSGKDKTVK